MKDKKELTIQQLLSNDEYRIPIYQRNYAWGITETTQLIQDVADYAQSSSANNYYIGNLIVFPKKSEYGTYYETIDGQQRITTLTILACTLLHNMKHIDFRWYKHINISFEHREKSNYTLKTLFRNPEGGFEENETNTDILTVSNNVWSIILRTCKDKEITPEIFVDYLLKKVIILRICVPQDTKLNHYFEIMNSRGEQLEQHEIVKAWLMRHIIKCDEEQDIKNDKEERMEAFNMIWEACANMDRYVQMNFNKKIRTVLFDNEGVGNIQMGFDDLVSFLKQMGNVRKTKSKTLFALFADSQNNISYRKPWEETQEKDYPETYHSIISFSNFLLHVLKLMNPDAQEVILDDKRLTKIFNNVIHKEDCKENFAKRFIMQLLAIRILFDTYIIKRKDEDWSLKRILPQPKNKEQYYYKDTFSDKDIDEVEEDNNNENKRIILLLSMFHVSAPTQIYKHWMNAALYCIKQNPNISSKDYAEYLWSLAKAYMLDRYLPNDKDKLPFETIIYKNKGKSQNTVKHICWENINIDKQVNIGEHVENFVFNFYDFLLWKRDSNPDFSFGYRTSVEHFYPQHPTNREPMDFNHLHSFGNLCLINRGMNSKFTNNLPGAKNDNFGSPEAMKTYSMKLIDMMNCIKQGNAWDENKILEKEQEAKELILENLQ